MRHLYLLSPRFSPFSFKEEGPPSSKSDWIWLVDFSSQIWNNAYLIAEVESMRVWHLQSVAAISVLFPLLFRRGSHTQLG